jgi:anthranilate phosphoribosyltransferase
MLDFLAVNAASCMVLMDKAKDLADGVIKAREAVTSGRARAQIEALIRAQNSDPASGLARFEALIA